MAFRKLATACLPFSIMLAGDPDFDAAILAQPRIGIAAGYRGQVGQRQHAVLRHMNSANMLQFFCDLDGPLEGKRTVRRPAPLRVGKSRDEELLSGDRRR